MDKPSPNFIYHINEDEEPGTLGAFLRRAGYSRSLLAALRHSHGVLVDGKERRMIDPLLPGETVEVRLPGRTPVLRPNPGLELPVLYEDKHIAVIDKPDDMLVHPAGRGFDDAVGNFCAARWPELALHPIGRLDRHTTGLLLIAKDRLTAAALTAGPVQKLYYALAEGRMEQASGVIDAPLLRTGGERISFPVDAAGKPSRTAFEVVEAADAATLVKVHPLTGRTHQIRSHFAHIGHPLAGDTLYGGGLTLISRPALHCGELDFVDMDGVKRHIASPLPDDLLAALVKAGIKQALPNP